MRENPHAAYDVAEAGNGVKGRTEASGDGENLRPTATPRRLWLPRQLSTLPMSGDWKWGYGGE